MKEHLCYKCYVYYSCLHSVICMPWFILSLCHYLWGVFLVPSKSFLYIYIPPAFNDEFTCSNGVNAHPLQHIYCTSTASWIRSPITFKNFHFHYHSYLPSASTTNNIPHQSQSGLPLVGPWWNFKLRMTIQTVRAQIAPHTSSKGDNSAVIQLYVLLCKH